MNGVSVDKAAEKDFIIAIKLHINQALFDKGHITEEMYVKAKELILRD